MIIAKPNRERVCFFGTAYFLTCSNVFYRSFWSVAILPCFVKHGVVVDGSKALNVLMRFFAEGHVVVLSYRITMRLSFKINQLICYSSESVVSL